MHKIQQIMHQRGIKSNRELARLSGVSHTSINEILRGRKRLHGIELEKIAAALNVSPQDLQQDNR